MFGYLYVRVTPCMSGYKITHFLMLLTCIHSYDQKYRIWLAGQPRSHLISLYSIYLQPISARASFDLYGRVDRRTGEQAILYSSTAAILYRYPERAWLVGP